MYWALPRTRPWRIGVLIGVICLGLLLAACARWRVWGPGDLLLYRQLKYHSPVAQALWLGDIRAGDPVERVTALSRPNRVLRLGPFLRMEYYPGGDPPEGSVSLEATALIAKEGRIRWAESYGCTFQRRYFDGFTPDEWALYDQLLQARIKARADARQSP